MTRKPLPQAYDAEQFLRIPRDGDQRSEVMAISNPN